MDTYLIARTEQLREEVEGLVFPSSLYVYDPLAYAWEPHQSYLERYASHKVDGFFLGMNPGPFGMAQSGVPFGEIAAVRDFLGIEGMVGKPVREHPKRPVSGFSCPRSEVSGRRLWGFMKQYYGTAEEMGRHLVVMNYCPLVFMDGGRTGKNVTPDKLDRETRARLDSFCDSYLKDCIDFFQPKILVGVGLYAKGKLEPFSKGRMLDSLIHPSPGNPQANKGWEEKTKAKFDSWGFLVPSL